jgi:hypothetical protein
MHAARSDVHEVEVQALDADLVRVDEEIAKIEAKPDALLDLVGSLAKERLLQKDAEFAAQQSALALRRADLYKQREQAAGAVLPIASVRAMCELVRRRMEGNPPFEERREIVHLLLTKIVATKERYHLYCMLPALDEALNAEGDDGAPDAIASTTVLYCCRTSQLNQLGQVVVGLGSLMPAPDGVQEHADERPDECSLHPSRADRGQGLEPARDAARREGIIATAQAPGMRRALVAAAWAEGECGRSYRRFTVHGGLLPFLCSTPLCSMARALPPDRLAVTRWVCPSSRLLPAAAAPPS